ncbi:TPA: IS1 family transposase [Escherichia coli]
MITVHCPRCNSDDVYRAVVVVASEIPASRQTS